MLRIVPRRWTGFTLCLLTATVYSAVGTQAAPHSGDSNSGYSVASEPFHATATVPAEERTFEELQLTLKLPKADEFKERELPGGASGGRIVGSYDVKVDGADMRINVWALSRDDYGMTEPTDMASLVRSNADGGPLGSKWTFADDELVPGEFGYATYADRLRAERFADDESTQVVAELHALCGLTEKYGYSIEIDLLGDFKARKEGVEWIDELFEEIEYDGEVRDAEWSKDEVEARWKRDFQPDIHDQRIRAFRTEHYIVIGTGSGAKAFGRAMEEYYDTIQEQFPFPEVEGQRLMPIFLFRTRTEYIEFYVHITGGSTTREQAARSAGHAWKDYYATVYESPKDPTHIHEATHQIFKARLGLNGGGSWFHEGVAVYMEGEVDNPTDKDIKNFGRAAYRRDEFQPFREFMVVPSLLQSNPDGGASNAYTQAGTIVDFVLKSKVTKDKSWEWIQAMGKIRRNDLDAIERELKRLFDVDIEGFQELYKEYWKRPKR